MSVAVQKSLFIFLFFVFPLAAAESLTTGKTELPLQVPTALWGGCNAKGLSLFQIDKIVFNRYNFLGQFPYCPLFEPQQPSYFTCFTDGLIYTLRGICRTFLWACRLCLKSLSFNLACFSSCRVIYNGKSVCERQEIQSLYYPLCLFASLWCGCLKGSILLHSI